MWICQAVAQFSPDGGQPGSIAIHSDSARWRGFATSAELDLGWLDIAQPSLGRLDVVVRDAVVGAPDGSAQPLGDGGIITVRFSEPFGDIRGYDFVVFENGFPTSDSTGFYELAFVEVSSNGTDFFRFPSQSLHEPDRFAGPFTELHSELLDGFAGRFSAPYGAPFDLSELPDDALLDKSAISHVRLIDVIGTADPAFAKTDDAGRVIVDPYPTPWGTCGFDLDAVGILAEEISFTINPPTKVESIQAISVLAGEVCEVATGEAIWLDVTGRMVHRGKSAPRVSGWYYLAFAKTPLARPIMIIVL